MSFKSKKIIEAHLKKIETNLSLVAVLYFVVSLR